MTRQGIWANSFAVRAIATVGTIALFHACDAGAGDDEVAPDELSDEASQVIEVPEEGPTGDDRMPAATLQPDELYQVELAPNTDFIDEHPDIESFEFDGKETVKMAPKKGKKLPFWKGRILLSKKHRMARKVVDVRIVDGNPHFITKPAKLNETFKRLRVDANVMLGAPFAAPDGKSDSGIEAPLEIDYSKERTKTFDMNKQLVDLGKLDVKTSGDLKLQYTFRLYVDFGLGDDTFKAFIRLDADSTAKLQLASQGAISKKGEVSLGSGWQIPWSVGVLSGVLDLDMVLNYEFEASGKASGTVDLGFDGMMYKVGAKWTSDDGWERIEGHDKPDWHSDHEIDMEAKLTATVFPALECAVLVYGLAGPELVVGPKFTSTMHFYMNPKNQKMMCLEAGADIQAEANFVVDILGFIELVEKNFGSWSLKHWDVFDDCWKYE